MMKTKYKNVYYCEFCKKNGLVKSIILKHEAHCTKNINRKCRVCELLEQEASNIKEIVEEFKGAKKLQELKELDDNSLLKQLNRKTNGCPACILAILRQLNIYCFIFDYKKEMESIFGDLRSTN